MDAHDSVSGIIDLLSQRGLLGAIGLSGSHARVMKARNSIPPRWHRPIVEVAKKNGLPIGYETLARLAADRASLRTKRHEQSEAVEG